MTCWDIENPEKNTCRQVSQGLPSGDFVQSWIAFQSFPLGLRSVLRVSTDMRTCILFCECSLSVRKDVTEASLQLQCYKKVFDRSLIENLKNPEL